MKELSIILLSDKATISQVVKKLENKNMVNILQSPKDKRKKLICVNESMSNNCNKLKEVEEKFHEKLTGNFTSKEINNLKDVILKLERNIYESN